MKIIFGLLLIILISGCVSHGSFVSRVVDGDTVVLSTGERIRLLGIDTPEKGQKYYQEAKDYLAGLVENKTVTLEADLEDKDKYGRSLRHIFIDGKHVNMELVKNGFASVLIIPPNKKYSEELLNAEMEAKEKELGIWQFNLSGVDFCISVFNLHYNALGNDNKNLNDEYATFRNKCNKTINMGGWVLKDNGSNEYIFPNLSLEGKKKITLHTGRGTDNQTDIFWGKERAVWNNNGDRVTIVNNGKIILDYSY